MICFPLYTEILYTEADTCCGSASCHASCLRFTGIALLNAYSSPVKEEPFLALVPERQEVAHLAQHLRVTSGASLGGCTLDITSH